MKYNEIVEGPPCRSGVLSTYDYVNRVMKFDLEEGTLELPLEYTDSTHPLEVVRFWNDLNELEITVHGEVIEIEYYDRSLPDGGISGRPIIYLDQNKWIELARVKIGNSILSPTELLSAREFMRMALERRIILPLSLGHLIETAKKKDSQRREVAMTMLQLSHGWQLENPFDVRKRELLEAIANYKGIHLIGNAKVVSLAPHHIFSSQRYRPDATIRLNGQTSEGDEMRQIIGWSASLCGIFADDRKSEINNASAEIKRWCDEHARLAEEMRNNTKARSKSRAVSLARMIASEIPVATAEAMHASGMTATEAEAWLGYNADKTIEGTKSLSIYREIMLNRLMNSNLTWVENDFIDLLVLPVAAGYADFLMCEKSTQSHIDRLRSKVHVNAATGRTFTEAMNFIHRHENG